MRSSDFPPLGIGVLLAGTIALVPLSAQNERLVVRLAPAPNQVVHLRTTREVTIEVSMSGPPGVAPYPPGGPMLTKSVHVYTVAGRMPDGQGRVEEEITIEQVATEINGQQQVPVMPLLAQFLTVSFDAQGSVADVTVSPADPAIAAAAKQLLIGMLDPVPTLTLAVGETVTIRRSLPLPLPLPSGGIDSIDATGETKYTLESVSRDGAARIAHLKLATVSQTRRTLVVPDGRAGGRATPTTVESSSAGDGTVDVDLDRGVVKATAQRETTDASIQAANPTGGAPLVTKIHVTAKRSTEAF